MVIGGGGGNTVRVRIIGDKTDLDKKLKGADKSVDKFGKTTERNLKATANKIKVGMAVAAVAIGTVVKSAIQRAEEMNSAYAITEQVIKKTGGAANLTAEQIKNLSRAQAFNTGINKVAITEGNNILLTFKNLRNEVGEGNDIYQRASDAMLDMATVMGTDAKSGAIQLGKALNDPILGVSALNRVGVQFTTTQKEQIRNFQESGDLMSAQKIILEELESQMGGTAVAAADDSAKIARSLDEITESLGMALLPVLTEVAKVIPRIFGQISRLQAVSLDIGADPKSVEAVTAAIKDLNFELDVSGRFMFGSELDDFAEGLEEIFDEAGLTIPQLVDLRNNIDFLTESFRLSDKEAVAFADSIRNRLINDAFGATRQPLQNFSEGLTDIQKAFGLTRQPIQNFSSDVTGAGTAAATADRKIKTKNIGRLGREYREAAAGVRDLKRAYLESTDPIFAAIAAAESQADAEERLKDIREDSKSSIEDIASAEADLAESTVAMADAFLRLEEGNLERGIALLAEALGITIQQAKDLLVVLGVLDASTFRPKIILDIIDQTLTPIERAAIDAAEAAADADRRTLIDATTGREASQGGNTTINLTQIFERVEGDNIDEDIARGILESGILRYVETS